MVKNPPASAGDPGLIPHAGRSHVLWSSELWSRSPGARAPELPWSSHRQEERVSASGEQPRSHGSRTAQRKYTPQTF